MEGGPDVTRLVPVLPLTLDELGHIIGRDRQAALTSSIAGTRDALAGRVVVHVNSTSTGGGVAEMLPTLLGYARGSGVDARWQVVEGTPEFFEVTKRLHNRLHGVPGDGGPLGPDERRVYDEVLTGNADDLLTTLRTGDLAVLHDPQTLGLAPLLHRIGVRTVWRCHIGVDTFNAETDEAWSFLKPYLDDVDRFVFTRADYRPDCIAGERVRIITPSLDPLSAKNRPMTEAAVASVLAFTGLIDGDSSALPPGFLRRDGSTARLERRADIVQLGPPVPHGEPLVVQVSRWDRLKDMTGVMVGFADHVATKGPGHLILAGPNVSGVSDDPEGARDLKNCIRTWRGLRHAVRQRIHLACLPVADVEENAVIVNALQRHASVVVQKSLAEGFGLTVLEAMWKGRPVVASGVGGIRDQIIDGESGLLLPDPADLPEFGRLVRHLLDDPAQASVLGGCAAERARHFLPDLHLIKWATLLSEVSSTAGSLTSSFPPA
jgi:trehalose synthase